MHETETPETQTRTVTGVAQAPTTAPSQRRAVTGRYLARVRRLTAEGEAEADVLSAVAAPSAEELAAVAGPGRPPIPQPEVVRCIGALPGEVVEVEVSWPLPRPDRKRARRVPEPSVRVVRVVEAAPQRVAAPCPVFGLCGGCQFQHLDYAAQLAWKAERVREELRAVGFAPEDVAALVRPTMGCEEPWHYRNHMRFSVDREGRAGLTERHSHRVLPMLSCPIADEHINTALRVLSVNPLPRPQVLLRYGVGTGHLIAQPTPSPEDQEQLAAHGLTVRTSDFEETLGGQRFRVRPSSFFQTNSAQAERMASLVLERLPRGPEVALVDAYCGVGTFARLMAGQAGRVLAIEESASAVRDAGENLRDAPNVEIVQGKVEDILPEVRERLDGLVIDPPRAGCQRPVLDALLARQLPRVVYVSCSPATLARDLAYLCLRPDGDKGEPRYRLISVQPLDMFPQTAHIENIALLEAIEATEAHA